MSCIITVVIASNFLYLELAQIILNPELEF